MAREVKLTREGFERLQRSLEQEQARLAEATRILQEQIADTDDYDDAGLEGAKREKALIEQRIDELEDTLSRAVIIETPGGTEAVTLGSFVVLKEERSGREMEVQVVSAPEASILDGTRERHVPKVSDDSPLGKSLLGRRNGELFIVDLENRQLKYKVVSIKGS